MTDLYAPAEPETPPDRPRRALPGILLIVAAAALLIVGVAAAIGRGDDSGSKVEDPVALLTGAPDAVRDKGSAHITMSMAAKVGGHEATTTMEGAAEFATRRASFTASVLGSSFDMVSDGTTMYVRLPEMFRSNLPKEWVAFPVGDRATPANVDSATGFLDALRGISDVKDVGVEKVNGVEATHYRGTVDLQEAIAAAPESQRAQAQRALGQLPAEMPVDVWLSSDGVPVRESFSFADANGLAGGLSMDVQIDFTDWGAPVDVQVPPADQVQRIDDPSKLGGLFGGVLG